MENTQLKKKKKRYWIDTDYTYNVFQADEHYVVYLMYGCKNEKMRVIGSWSYSTFTSERLAHLLAERKINKLRLTYDAKML
jgi:ribonuclease PH